MSNKRKPFSLDPKLNSTHKQFLDFMRAEIIGEAKFLLNKGLNKLQDVCAYYSNVYDASDVLDASQFVEFALESLVDLDLTEKDKQEMSKEAECNAEEQPQKSPKKKRQNSTNTNKH